MSLLTLFASAAAPAAFSPADLFASGEKGYWYDPSDFSTMFQDSAGTTPVTAAGEPVGLIQDKSGNGNHMTSSGTARPTIEQDVNGFWYLKGDGVDGVLSTPSSVTLGSPTKMTAFVGKKPDTNHNGMATEYSTNGTALIGTFAQFFISGTDEIYMNMGNNAYGDLAGLGTAAAINTMIFDADLGASTADAIKYRVNGVLRTFTSVSGNNPGTGVFSNERAFMLGRDAGNFPYNGRIYGYFARAAGCTAQEIEDSETWLNDRMGAF